MSTSSFSPRNYSYWAALPAAIILILHIIFYAAIHDQGLMILLSDIITVLISAWAAAAMFLAAHDVRPLSAELFRFWRIMGFAQLALAIGETAWSFYETVLGEPPFPSIADAIYLLYYPLFLVAIRYLPGGSRSRIGWTKNTIDMLIVFMAAVLVFWNFFLGPLIVSGSSNPLLGQLLTVAYPVGDLLQIWALLQIVYRLPGNPIRLPLGFLAAGALVTILMDLIFGYQNLLGTYQSAGVLDIGYTAGYLLYGLAGVWMVSSKPGSPDSLEERRSPADLPFWLYHLPYAWVLCSYLLLIFQPVLHLPMSQTEMTLFVGIIITLVILRQMVVIQENHKLYDEIERQSQELEEANWDLQAEVSIRRRAEEKLSHDAMHDSLTGLPNRAFFTARLKQAARHKQSHPEFQYSVLFLDLDKFKVVNDSLGHTVGDQLLARVAQILPNCVRATDTVARLGGDEFVILLEDMRETGGVLQIASRILKELSKPLELEGARVFVTASLGIVLNINENDTPDDILQDADLAMYQAKTNGKDRYAVFEPQMRALARQRLLLENDLRRGFEAGEFCLYYQPIFSLPTYSLAGMEALLRWKHPLRGLLQPSDFLRMAEETGLIVPIGARVLEEACRQRQAWLSGYPHLSGVYISVNLSAGQIADSDFYHQVCRTIGLTHLPGDLLAFEITESIWNVQQERLRTLLPRLTTLGIQCQMDHFGVGHSSLSALNEFPIHTAKVNIHLFEDNDSPDAESPRMAAALFSLLKELGIQGIAAGIENAAQAGVLARLGCTGAQGFALARPMDAGQATQWLAEYTPPITVK